MLKKEGIFCEIVFVGVHRCGREQFRKKQATAGKTQCFPAVFVITGMEIHLYTDCIYLSSLAVDRLFLIHFSVTQTVAHPDGRHGQPLAR